MDSPESTQSSRSRPQNPYKPQQPYDTQDTTMITTRTNTTHKRIPPKSTLYDWIKPKITVATTTDTLPDTNNTRRPTEPNHKPKPLPTRKHHQQILNPT